MPDSSATTTYFVESLARGLAVLALFSKNTPTLSLTEISQSLDLNKTTALRLLSTLTTLKYLKRDPETKRYQPGLEILRLGFVVLSELEVREVAAPYLRQLVNDVAETVNLAVLDGPEVVYIDRLASKKQRLSVHTPLGARLPAYCTSTGKSLLAFLPPAELAEYLAATEWVQHTPQTITDPARLQENLALVQQRGFADSNTELFPELRAVAAPIRQHDGQVVATVNISVPAHRVTYEAMLEHLGPEVIDSARQISEALGYKA